MKDHKSLEPGESVSFTTRPVGMKTTLFMKNVGKGDGKITVKPMIAVDPTDFQFGPGDSEEFDLSFLKGGLAEVRNTGMTNVEVWTDYI